MDSLITAAARALATGDILGAMNRVALRDDPPALALRGIAMAQLGEFDRAKVLLKRAARGFGAREAVSRARCVVAEAEIALVSRDLRSPAKSLSAARVTLEVHGDALNAAHARHLEIRRQVLVGDLHRAKQGLAELDLKLLPPAWRAMHELVVAEIAMRKIEAGAARAALERAREAAQLAGIPALNAEVSRAFETLNAPVARLVAPDAQRSIRLEDAEALMATGALVVDACRHAVRKHQIRISLARRPVLLSLARALAQAWPGDVSRDDLVRQAFRARSADESHRARLRVEMARLRKAIAAVATVVATRNGFALVPVDTAGVAVMAPPVEEGHEAVLALLNDGEAWSSSALALALGKSQRGIQRSLEALSAKGRIQHFGNGRARRWVAPAPLGFATTLLLPGGLPFG
ncbi:MAG: helix-turn-helix domain-containing protein [Sphingomonas sp.]|uniref:helix-turn-helix domain-containing protein n=1 Tax=Sphingomonas sp. TaxID=28214 RepID=UPI001B240EDB|nr:helix-turn-helix domain-containing protein [Sphingomonas sp.]MBO9621550.1 helix-turn-helix domain-containing protein [Sphingomonas sp.]